MTSPLGGVVPVGIGALTGPASVASTTATGGTEATKAGDGFAAVLAKTFDQLQNVQSTADGLSRQAATGQLRDVGQYMVAGTEAKLATEMVVTLKNQAVAAFNEIMRMPI